MQNQILTGKPVRNQSLEVFKLMASFFVVFSHVPFPGTFGGILSCVGRFAVPLFFAVSGWFSYQADCGKLAKRFVHILKLEGIGILIMTGWSLLVHTYLGSDIRQWLLAQIPDGEQLRRWLLWNVEPFGGHLWYLSASALCYALLWGYTRLQQGKALRYGLFYGISVCLLAAHFAMDEFYTLTGILADFTVYRSGIFMGLPLFAMGMFLRQHRQRFTATLTAGKSTLVLLFGMAVSLLEWQIFGGRELYLGTVLTVSGMLLLASQIPDITVRFPKAGKGISKCAAVSTAVYLLHLPVYDFYQTFLSWRFTGGLGEIIQWILPLGVLLVSLMAAVLWTMITDRLRSRTKTRKRGNT